MKLSIVIPAHNEEDSLPSTVESVFQTLREEKIDHEILVINDGSKDKTESVLQGLQTKFSTLRYLNNEAPNGFGYAVRRGLENFTGDCVAVYMADASDAPSDLVAYYKVLSQSNVDCVFGSRFMKGSQVLDYPWIKLFINRLANLFIKVLFRLKFNDITNAFKIYRREVIEGVQPFLSPHFNLTVELPLKAIVRGYTFEVIPISWSNRKHGVSKLKIKEMGSRYLFIVLYCLIEKTLSRGDYRRKESSSLAKSSTSPAKA